MSPVTFSDKTIIFFHLLINDRNQDCAFGEKIIDDNKWKEEKVKLTFKINI